MRRLVWMTLVFVFFGCSRSEPSTSTASTATEAATATTPATPSDPVLEGLEPYDHYKLWRAHTANLDGDLGVSLGGPDVPPWQTTVVRVRYLGNPATKVHDGKPYPVHKQEVHYVAYELSTSARPQKPKATVTNQFGRMSWDLGSSTLLLVPAWTSPIGATLPEQPPEEQHYLCYAADAVPWSGRIDVTDQEFDAAGPERIEQLTPSHLCMPVQKKHGATTAPIKDEKLYLALYHLCPMEHRPNDRQYRDQFVRTVVHASTSELLAVPSRVVFPDES